MIDPQPFVEQTHSLLTPFSGAMALALFTVAALILSLVLRRSTRGGIACLLLVCLLTLLRILLPIEPPGSLVIRSSTIYPAILHALEYRFLCLTVLQWLLVVWGVGTVVTGILLGRQLLQQQNSYRKLLLLDEQDRIYRLCLSEAEQLGLHDEIDVYLTPDSGTAYLVGLRRPKIIFSLDLADLSDTQIRYVARHELCHYAKKDLWIKLFLMVLRCLLWWNPAVWLLYQSVEQMLELRADTRACASLSPEVQLDYLDVLLQLARTPAHHPVYVGASIGAPNASQQLRQRIQFILNNQDRPVAAWKTALICVLCVVVFVASYFFIVQPYFALPVVNATDSNLITVTNVNSYIVQTKDGQYQFFVDGCYVEDVTDDMIQFEPFCSLPIINEEENRSE